MSWVKYFRWIMAGLLLISVPFTFAANHVRVVLDTSLSMPKNDPKRLAVLSTLLLHDLAAPNSTIGDSFQVIPFDRNWQWPSPDKPVPISEKSPIISTFGQRQDFVSQLNQLPYDARMTYFYPGLKVAIDQLNQTPGGEFDLRTLVLVTDGLPEDPTQEKEAQLLADELKPLMEQNNIRFYILAFGQKAFAQQTFFDAIIPRFNGIKRGELFVDPDGSRLLTNMISIFSRSFGFTADSSIALPGAPALNLEGGVTPNQAIVVVLSNDNQVPSVNLSPPPGGSVNNPEGLLSASEQGASYSLRSVLSPTPGSYSLNSSSNNGSVAVLRPTRLALKIVPSANQTQASRAMAKTPFSVRVLVSSPIGAVGDPGAVDLSFRLEGPRIIDADGNSKAAFELPPSSPPPGTGVPTQAGRYYDIVMQWPENSVDVQQPYTGYLKVEARRGEAVVGELSGTGAHTVEVNPLIAITTTPQTAYVSQTALTRRANACTTFNLNLEAGELPHPENPEYGLKAVIDFNDPSIMGREFNLASFVLDERPLQALSATNIDNPGPWYNGLTLTQEQLFSEHTICVTLGKPTEGNPANPIDLPVKLTLNEAPYDEFNVIVPFVGKILVAPPTFTQKYGDALFLGTLFTALLTGLWYFRNRPTLPKDIRYAITREESDLPQLPSKPLPEGSPLRRLLGLVVKRPLIIPGETNTLGYIVPLKETLYGLQTENGVKAERLDEEKQGPISRTGLTPLSVQRLYRLKTDQGNYLLRINYELVS